MADAKCVMVEVAYATPEEQLLMRLEVPVGTSVGETIVRSGLLARFPEIDVARHGVGIFGERVELERPIMNGDRVEIYRPLIADPKEARRRRAEVQGRRARLGR